MPPSMAFHQSPRGARPDPALADAAREIENLRAENAQLKKQMQMSQQSSAVGGSIASIDDIQDVAELRNQLIAAQRTVSSAQSRLEALLPEQTATSRAGYLQPLIELIGPPPTDRTWEAEWIPLKAESYRLSGQGEETVEADQEYVRQNDNFDQFGAQDWVQADISQLVASGWPQARAMIYTFLFTCVDALARALRERDQCYAASTYALSEVLFAQRQGADADNLSHVKVSPSRAHGKAASSEVPNLYSNRTGLFSLTQREPLWERIEVPDGTGFRGLTSSALTHASADPMYFCEEGFKVAQTSEDGENGWELKPQVRVQPSLQSRARSALWSTCFVAVRPAVACARSPPPPGCLQPPQDLLPARCPRLSAPGAWEMLCAG